MILNLLKWILILIFCFGLALYIAFSPTHLSEVVYNGRPIAIERDHYGVATIHIDSMEEYLYGLGTIIAEDRLFQMSFRAYAAQGRLS
jgi:acyl-homoserine lactone acylase PvdQ